MLLSAGNVSKTVSLRVAAGGIIVLIARFETSGMHEMWHNLAPRFRRRKDAA